MTARVPALGIAGMAGMVILALALHLLMLAGVGVSHPMHDLAPGAPATAVAHGEDARAQVRTPEHPGHHHVLVDCMALVAVLGLVLLNAAARRTSPHREHHPPPQQRPVRHMLLARECAPLGPLVTRGVLLRV